MAGIQFPCPACGHQVRPGVSIGGGATVVMKGSRTVCPNCHRTIPIPDGTYRFIDDVIGVLRDAPEEQIERLRAVTAAVASGLISKDDAVAQATQIRPEMGRLLKQALGWGIPNLLAALALWVAVQAKHSSDLSGEQAHQDMLKSQSQNELVIAELKHLSEMQASATPPQQQIHKPNTSPASASGPARKNRHERRKSAAHARRRS